MARQPLFESKERRKVGMGQSGIAAFLAYSAHSPHSVKVQVKVVGKELVCQEEEVMFERQVVEGVRGFQ